VHACVCVRAKRAHMSAFAYVLTDYVHIWWEHTTTHYMWQGLSIFTHRAHACERVCARARVIKRSLIFGRILFKFAGHMLKMTTSYMGYILITFTYRGHARERERANASVRARA
jgi:hypothetical protein